MLSDPRIFSLTNFFLRATHLALIRRFRRVNGHFPNIADPQNYAERMLWRKILDRNPQFVLFCDKLAAKDYVQRLCPELPVPRTLWIGCDTEDIPGELLRGDVYVKANHGCDFNFRIRDGKYDRAALRKNTARWLRKVYGERGGEWSYSRVKPRLFVEEAIGDPEQNLIELNVRAGNGKAIVGSMIGHCKTARQWSAYLDRDGKRIQGAHEPDDAPLKPLPGGLDVTEPYLRAVRFTERLSAGVDYARFDFMWNGRVLYGGEITVFPAGGWRDLNNSFVSKETLRGWDLRQSHFFRNEQRGWKRLYAGALKRRLEGEPGSRELQQVA